MAVRMTDDPAPTPLVPRGDPDRGAGGTRSGPSTWPRVIGVLEELEYDPDTRHISRRGLRMACVRREWLLADLCRVADVARVTADKWDLGAAARRPSEAALLRVVRALSERRIIA